MSTFLRSKIGSVSYIFRDRNNLTNEHILIEKSNNILYPFFSGNSTTHKEKSTNPLSPLKNLRKQPTAKKKRRQTVFRGKNLKISSPAEGSSAASRGSVECPRAPACPSSLIVAGERHRPLH